MSKQDNSRRALSEGSEARFHSFLMHKKLVPQQKIKYFVG
jgi:hypothetical protein